MLQMENADQLEDRSYNEEQKLKVSEYLDDLIINYEDLIKELAIDKVNFAYTFLSIPITLTDVLSIFVSLTGAISIAIQYYLISNGFISSV